MKTDTLTDRLHAKADADLRKKITESMQWILDESGYATRGNGPKIEDHPRVSDAMASQGQARPSAMPWIGSIQAVHTEVAFAYLRDKWRSRYVFDFMSKVEAMASEMENLGLVIQSQDQPQE